MNIIHISTKSTWGGGEKQVWYLLNELHKKGITQTLVCAKDSALADKCRTAGFSIVELPKGPLFTVTWGLGLAKITQAFAKTILHIHDGQAHNVALVHTLFSAVKNPLVVHRRIIKKNISIYQRWKFNHHAIKKIICISSAVRENLLHALYDPAKIVLIPSGIDTTQNAINTLSKEAVKNRFGIPKDSRLIVNIGSLVPQKHQMTFLAAAKIFLNKNAEQSEAVRFAIVGEGPLRVDLEKFISHHSLTKHCLLLGFSNAVPDILAASDILVSTSVDEAFGNVIMEAFQAGTPVIATRSGGVQDLIEHKITGLLVEPLAAEAFAENCSFLLKHPETANTLRRNAFEKLSKFSIVSIADEIYKVYLSIFENSER